MHMLIVHADKLTLAQWEHELLGDILARNWDGTHRDRLRDTHDNPLYWTDEDYRCDYVTPTDLIARHLDKTPNVA